MNFCIVSVFVTLLALGSSINLIAQATSIAQPQDPMALMTLAHNQNGLAGSDVKPWHLRGTYRSFGANGKPEYEGTYEEWWVSATKYKLSFTNPKSTQTDYATGSILLRDGSQEWQTGPELLLRASVIEPLPDVSQLREFTLQHFSQTVGKASIQCVGLTYPLPPNLDASENLYPVACFEPGMPLLRVYSVGSSVRIIYDHIVLFQGHYVPRNTQIFVSGKLAADMNLDVIENLRVSPDAIVDAPSTALPVDLKKIRFKDGTTSRWPELLKRAFPVYPQEAKSMRIQGIVNIKATTGPDGHVESMQFLDGPSMLRQAALDAVSKWLYRPFDVMGEPRPVEVEVHVVFTMK